MLHAELSHLFYKLHLQARSKNNFNDVSMSTNSIVDRCLHHRMSMHVVQLFSHIDTSQIGFKSDAPHILPSKCRETLWATHTITSQLQLGRPHTCVNSTYTHNTNFDRLFTIRSMIIWSQMRRFWTSKTHSNQSSCFQTRPNVQKGLSPLSHI